MAFDFDLNSGNLTNKRTIVEFDKWLDGTPDGQCIDVDGNLWVAMYLGGRVIKVDTTTGKNIINQIILFHYIIIDITVANFCRS